MLSELLGLVRRAPGNRTLVVSRTGVALSCLHVTAALVVGAFVFSHGDAPVRGSATTMGARTPATRSLRLAHRSDRHGRPHARADARASAAAPVRRFPSSEVALTAGLWTLLAGVLLASTPAALVGGCVILLTLAQFARLMVGVARTRRMELEAPLAHLLTGVFFLLQAAALGAAVLVGAIASRTGLTATSCSC